MKKGLIHIILFFITIVVQLTALGQSGIDSLEIALEIENDPIQKVNILLLLVDEYESGNQDVALEYAEQALELSLASEYSLGELKSMNALAKVLINKTDFKTSMDYTVKAKSMAEVMENKTELGHALYNMGHIYTDLGIYDKSSELYYECLRLSEQIDDRILECKTLNSIGIVHHNQNNYDKALEYYFKALSIAKEIDYDIGISKGLNNVAAIYGIRGDYEKVVKYLREAIALNNEQHNMKILGVNYLNYGYYFQEMEQYDSALVYFNRALQLYYELDNVSSILSAKIFLAEFFLKSGDLDKSKQYAEESLNEGRENGLKRFVYETASLLTKIHFAQNDSTIALRYQILELQMKDSLNIEESQTQISKLELQYELEKTEQVIRSRQQQKDLINIIILISLVFIIIVIVLIMGRMRIKARAVILEKDKYKMNLEIRNRELTANVMSILKKNEMLMHIARKLKGIQKDAVKDETKMAIRKIAREMNKAVEQEPWQEFELRFKQVHNEFYDNLIEKFPTLSPQEQRLCAFLKLNMTTKEISEITGQRTSTIEMARTRLRKKLGITNTQTNLITFLSQI